MGTSGLKRTAIAAGLSLAAMGLGAGAIAAPTPTPQQAAAPAGVSNTAPTTAAATPPAAPSSPMLAVDGAPGAVAQPGIGQPSNGVFGLQPQVTRNGEFAHWMHNAILFPVITIISLFVLGLLIWVVIRYRAQANPIPSKTSHNTTIEVIWTLLPVAILVLIALPSIGLLQAQFKPAPAGAVTLKAIGNQWYWSYQYPDHGGI